MSTTLKSNSTDAEINAAVAEHVAGWKRFEAGMYPPNLHSMANILGHEIPDYLHDANAVIKLLEKYARWLAESYDASGGGRTIGVSVYPASDTTDPRTARQYLGRSDTFCRAACFALLRANGVTI